MEFVEYGEALDLLKEQGIREVDEGGEFIGLQLSETDEIVHVHLACGDSSCEPHGGANVIRLEKDQIPGAVEQVIHKLHLVQVLLIPVAKWRKVFDAVAFSMADNEDWQAVDTMATVALNRRDPLLCEPADYHVINSLIGALLTDADSPDQGLLLTTTAAPVMIELVPAGGAVRIAIGNPVLADEVAEVLSAKQGRD